MNAPWFILHPALFRSECRVLARDFSEMRRDDEALEKGRLEFEGIVVVAVGPRNEAVRLRLRYPSGFPYARPEIIALESGDGEAARARFFSTRHQMAQGLICLFEQDVADDPRAYTTGAAALRRALIWLPHAIRGRLPHELDNQHADLEAHYERCGDVLCGPLMYGDLARSGELVLFDLRKEEYPLALVTHVESARQWQCDRTAFERIGSRLPEELWTPTPPPAGRRVRWYALDHEPPPIRSSAELASLLFPDESAPLDVLKRSVAQARHESLAVDVPVRVPGRGESTYEWLFFHFPIRATRQPRVGVRGIPSTGVVLDVEGADALDDVRPLVLRVHDLRPRSLQVRNRGRIPTSTSELQFALAGAGALGSMSADLFAKAGVAGLRIVDPEVLDVHNAVRHTSGVRGAGMPKAFLVASSASDHNPYCGATFLHGSVFDVPATDPFWQSPNTIVSTIADDAVELALNRTATSRGSSVYYFRALRSGSAGRLVRVRPGIDACLECVAHYHDTCDPRAIVVPRAEDEVVARECGRPVLAASAADLAIVGGLGVRQILLDLAEPGAINQWVWTTEGIPEVPELLRPFSTASVALPPHPSCAICAPSEIRRLRVPEEIRTFMVDEARRHAPSETGGILVGRRIGDVIEVLFASDAGPNAISSPTRFERDGPHSQEFLERVAVTSPGVDYVGEWHSHPDGDPAPSARDVTSFKAIAGDPDYVTTVPVLIITAPAASGPDVGWSQTVFSPRGIAKSLELETTTPLQRIDGN